MALSFFTERIFWEKDKIWQRKQTKSVCLRRCYRADEAMIPKAVRKIVSGQALRDWASTARQLGIAGRATILEGQEKCFISYMRQKKGIYTLKFEVGAFLTSVENQSNVQILDFLKGKIRWTRRKGTREKFRTINDTSEEWSKQRSSDETS